MSKTLQFRRGLSASFTTENPTLVAGELGYETDTKKIKIGDGVTKWQSLSYFAAFSGTGNASFLGAGVSNSASGSNAFVGAGSSNNASGGSAVICGGGSNTASNSSVFVGAGTGNNASGNSSVICGGGSNTVSGSHATVIGGFQATADRWGMVAHSGGRFSGNGDSQHAIFVLRIRTSNATPTTLLLDGVSTRLTIPNGKALFAIVQISGIRSDGVQAAHYVRKVGIKNVSNTCSLVGTVSTLGTDVEDNSAWDVAITADNTFKALQINVTGDASTTIRWTAVVDAVEIAYGT